MKLPGKIVVRSMANDFMGGRGVVIGFDANNGSFAYIKGPPAITRLEEGTLIMDPTFDSAIGTEVLQAALEHAWEIGMRPKNWRAETTEQVEAMDNHLQDMRRLVFDRAGKGGGADDAV